MSRLNALVLATVLAGYQSFVPLSATAESDSKPDLPAGQYVYLGEDGSEKPKNFKIKSNGEIVWQGSERSDGESKANGKSLIPKLFGKKNASDEMSYIESFNYPVIKWKPVEVMGLENGVVKLNTTLDKNGRSPDQLRFTLEAQLPYVQNNLLIKLMDKDGFKVYQFVVPARLLSPVGKDGRYEAQDTVRCDEQVYRQVRSYSVGI